MKNREKTLKPYVIILKKDLEKIMDFYIKEGKAKLLDRAILYDQSQNVTPDLLKKIISQAAKSKQFFQILNYYFIKLPLKSYTGEEIGYIAVSYDATSTVRLFRFVTLALVVTFIIISVFFVISVNKVLYKNASTLITTAKAMEELAQGRGDLTFRLKVEKEDEMGLLSRYFNQFMESLAAIIRQFLEKVRELFSSSEELNKEAQVLGTISEDLSKRADAINISSAEILSAVEEISRSLQELSKAIAEISKSAQGSSKVVRETVNTVEETKNRVELLTKASNEIDEVITLINDIAKQTNLLALNASIEAARAGESGRGFAVVANEVKKLATQTQEATKVIAEKIYLLKQSSEEVSNGVEEVVTLIRRVEDAATAIAGAVEEQSIVINNISQHILNVKEKVMVNEDQTNQIKKTVEDLIVIIEQINKISQNLHIIAQEIHNLASQFKT